MFENHTNIATQENSNDLTKFKMYVRIPHKTITIEVNPSDTIKELKNKIEKEENIPSNRQRIIIAGQEWTNSRTIKELSTGSTVCMLLKESAPKNHQNQTNKTKTPECKIF